MCEELNETDFIEPEFFTLFAKSESELLEEFRKYKAVRKKRFYFQILSQIKTSIENGKISLLQKINALLVCTRKEVSALMFLDYRRSPNNPLRNVNIIILACKYSQPETIEFIFSKSIFLQHLPVTLVGQLIILPTDIDEYQHNAFYYAIRSGKTKVFQLLLENWSDEYPFQRSGELYVAVTSAYRELKLKNVELPNDMEFLVREFFFDVNFHCDFQNQVPDEQTKKNIVNHNDKTRKCEDKLKVDVIVMRIELVLNNIRTLTRDYTSVDVDGTFLVIAKFIAKNVQLLKRHLEFTYDKIPWEEIEFCLVIFIMTETQCKENHLLHSRILTKKKLLSYLENFANCLNNTRNLIENDNEIALKKKPTLNALKALDKEIESSHSLRDVCTLRIVKLNPLFEELFKDYHKMRDEYSLKIMRKYLDLAISVKCDVKGIILITRALQVVGEHLKNTLESPNISNTTCELLLLSLPKNTREVVKGLRDSLSHADSMSKRLEIEKSKEEFFNSMQDDLKKLNFAIVEVLCKSRIRLIRDELKKISECGNEEELKEIFKSLRFEVAGEELSEIPGVSQLRKMKILIKKLSDHFKDKSEKEKSLFNHINYELFLENHRLTQIKMTMIMALNSYNRFVVKIQQNNFENVINEAKRLLKETHPNIESSRLNNILVLSEQILECVSRDLDEEKLNEIKYLQWQLVNSGVFEIKEIKLIKTYKFNIKEKKSIKLPKELKDNLLSQKLAQLNKFFSDDDFRDINKFKIDMKSQVILEMLVLDIYSLLNDVLSYNHNYLDDEPVTLIGRNMRNHLAHNNTLTNILSVDALMDLLLNAKKISTEIQLKNISKIGKVFYCNFNKLQCDHKRDVGIISLQKEMCMALSSGDVEIVKTILQNGADIKARYVRSKTALHFASEGTSIETIILVLNEKCKLGAKDENDQTALHIAARHGRSNLVEYLINIKNLFIDQLDKYRKTALHIAAEYGHVEAGKILINSGASTTLQDVYGYSPLHYSVHNNHEDIFKLLIKLEKNVDDNDAFGGLTPLYIAARSGHLGLVNYLLDKNANVNAKTDTHLVPLHAAVQGGHLEIARSLIEKGANVNARCMDGITALHMVSISGKTCIFQLLLERVINVDDVINIFKRSPLAYAAQNGNAEIVELLLKPVSKYVNTKRVKVNTKDVTGKTPLHFAAENGHINVVQILLKNQASLKCTDYFDCTAMHYAAYYGHINVVNLLIEHRGSIHAKDIFQASPLNLAVVNGHLNCAKALIDKKADVNNTDILNSTSLHKCLEKNYLEIASLLIKSKADIHIPSLQFRITPLHLALGLGSKDMLEVFVDRGANFNDIKTSDFTALHLGIINGDLEFMKYLIRCDIRCKCWCEFDVNAKSKSGLTALHLAVERSDLSVIELLVDNKANLDARDNFGHTPLYYAVRKNNKRIIDYLIKNKATVKNEGFGEPLASAIIKGFDDVVTTLLDKGQFDLNVKLANNDSLLVTSVLYSHKKITEILLLHKAGIDDKSNNVTALFTASLRGNFEIVKLLLEKGANPNSESHMDNLTPLYSAVTEGHIDIVDILLCKGVSKVDSNNRTALEIAVRCSRVEVVKFLLDNNHGDVNEKTSDQLSLLYQAAHQNELEIVKYLILKGAVYNADEKPIVVAASNGHKNIVEFLFNNGDWDICSFNQAFISAVQNGHLEVTKYLVKSIGDHFKPGKFYDTLSLLSAEFNRKCLVLYFLDIGVYYNSYIKDRITPFDVISCPEIKHVLKLIKMVFIAIKRHKLELLEHAIKKKANLNAKRKDNATALHYAAWKGHCDILDALLKNCANPNIIGKCHSTPLHYAAKFGHFDIVKSLLSHGALYNIESSTGKTPLQYSTDNDIKELLSLVDKSFRSIQKGNLDFLEDLAVLRDPKTIKSVMKSRNKENNILVTFAMRYDFPKINELKQVLEVDLNSRYAEATKHQAGGRYSKSLQLFEDILKRMTEDLGPDHPNTLDVKDRVGEVLLKQHENDKALKIFEDNFETRKESLGSNDIGTLQTQRYLALTLHKLERKSEALQILQEVYNQQCKHFGEIHPDVLRTQFIMASMLEQEGKFEDAMNLFCSVYELHKQSNCENHPNALETQAEIVMILIKQKKYDSAIEKLQHLHDTQTDILGPNDPSTLQSRKNKALVYRLTGKYKRALKLYETILKEEETTYGQDNVYFLTTLYSIGEGLVLQQRFLKAFKIFTKCYNNGLEVMSPNHIITQQAQKKMGLVKFLFSLEHGEVGVCVLEQMEKDIRCKTNEGQACLVESLQKESEMYWELAKRNYPFNRLIPDEWSVNPDELTSESFINFVKDLSNFRAICNGDYSKETGTHETCVDKDVFYHMKYLKNKNSGIHMKFDEIGSII